VGEWVLTKQALLGRHGMTFHLLVLAPIRSPGEHPTSNYCKARVTIKTTGDLIV
jgi:hypothetical protein